MIVTEQTTLSDIPKEILDYCQEYHENEPMSVENMNKWIEEYNYRLENGLPLLNGEVKKCSCGGDRMICYLVEGKVEVCCNKCNKKTPILPKQEAIKYWNEME